MPNLPLAHFCTHCGFALRRSPAKLRLAFGPSATRAQLAAIGARPSEELRVLEGKAYAGLGLSQDAGVGSPAGRFGVTEKTFHIRLRLAHLHPAHWHLHGRWVFVQFFRPNGRLHSSYERPELVVAEFRQAEIETSIFGLRIAGTQVVNYPGTWRAAVYLDEEKMIELPFEITTFGNTAAR